MLGKSAFYETTKAKTDGDQKSCVKSRKQFRHCELHVSNRDTWNDAKTAVDSEIKAQN